MLPPSRSSNGFPMMSETASFSLSKSSQATTGRETFQNRFVCYAFIRERLKKFQFQKSVLGRIDRISKQRAGKTVYVDVGSPRDGIGILEGARFRSAASASSCVMPQLKPSTGFASVSAD